MSENFIKTNETRENSKDDSHAARQSADWDIKNAPKNYLTLVLAQGGTAFFSFASVWLITKTLGSEGYGAIVAIIAASQLIQIFVNWSGTALARFGIEEFVETGKISKSFWTRTLVFTPNLLLILLGGGLWLAPLAEWLKISGAAKWLIAAHILTTAVWLHVQFGLQGVKMLRRQGVFLAVERGLTFVALLLLSGLNRTSPESFLWCYILPPVLMAIVGLIFLRPFIGFGDFYDAVQFRKMLVYSLPLIPFAVVGYLSTSQLDAVFITRYLSTKDLGIYSIATQISGITFQLPILANSILLSMFVSLKTAGNDSPVERFFRQIVPSLTLLWGFLCVVLAFVCVFLIPAIFGREFASAAGSLWILLAASTVNFPVLTGLATLCHTYSKTYITMYAAIFMATTNVLFNALLIPRFGMVGCAWATVAAGFANLSVCYFFLRREKLLSGGWLFQAALPVVGSALIYTIYQNIASALTVCAVITAAIVYFQFDSLKESFEMIRKKFQKAETQAN